MLERIIPKKFFIYNLLLLSILFIGNLVGIILTYKFEHDYVYGLVPLFSFDREMNIPTLYSALAILFASSLLIYIGRKCKADNQAYISWFALGGIFIFLALDETFLIHENLIVPVREYFNTSGLFFYAWVIPYGLAVVLFLGVFSKFLINLPRRSLILFVSAEAIFVTGAIGFELLGGKHAEIHGRANVAYTFYYTFEESLEMIGIALFNFALLLHIKSHKLYKIS